MINIAIIGKMATGKSTLAQIINSIIYKDKGCICNFAGPIKEIYNNRDLLSSYMITVQEPNKYDDKIFTKKEKPLIDHKPFMDILEKLDKELQSGAKPRKHYQFLGDFFKAVYGKDFWANKLFKDFEITKTVQKTLNNDIEALIIDDLRMKIEYETLLNKQEEFIILTLEVDENVRKNIISNLNLGTLDTFNHNSETEIDDIIGEIKANNYNNMYSYSNGERLISISSTKNKPINKKFLRHIESILKEK